MVVGETLLEEVPHLPGILRIYIYRVQALFNGRHQGQGRDSNNHA